MSGGQYDYAYSRVNDFAYSIVQQYESWDTNKPTWTDRPYLALRQRFAAHLEAVAEAMRTIEWADSGDKSDEAVEQCLLEFFQKCKEAK